MKRKKSKTSKTYLKWRARVNYKNGLKKWSKDIRARDNNKCVVCGRADKLQAHHILDKKYYKHISLDLDVGITLCIFHHKWSKFAAHTNVIWFASWLNKNRPAQYTWCLNQTGAYTEEKTNG